MMTQENTITCTCPGCGASVPVKTHPGVNVAEEPAMRARILDGSAMRWKCPHCGTESYASYPLLYHSPADKFMVWLYPENLLDASFFEYGDKVSALLPQYRLRRVDNLLRLAEKIQIFEQGASDVAVELSKLIFKHEMAERYKDDRDRVKEIYDSNIFCHGFRLEDGECAEFTVSLVDPSGQHAYFSIAPRIYADSLGIISRNPQLAPGKGFATIDYEWVSHRIE